CGFLLGLGALLGSFLFRFGFFLRGLGLGLRLRIDFLFLGLNVLDFLLGGYFFFLRLLFRMRLGAFGFGLRGTLLRLSYVLRFRFRRAARHAFLHLLFGRERLTFEGTLVAFVHSCRAVVMAAVRIEPAGVCTRKDRKCNQTAGDREPK